NSTRLTAQIAAADIATAGTASVAVINHDSGQHSSAVNFFVNTTAPAPQISRLTPDAAVACGPAVALTVTGTNFVSGAVVRWNGANRPTSFVSSTQLTAQIAAADIAAASTASVVVANPDGGVSNALPFAINAPEPAPGTNPLFLPLVEKH
ncbi:MAG TPA: IPT/TIG domain-containing protein, partial [Roseiflexaceae bacterium]